MGAGLNRIGNTAAIPVRLGGTVVTTTADLFTNFYTFSKEGFEIIADTSQKVKNVLLGAWNHGKWYHKALNIPLSPVIVAGTALEGVIRSVVQPVVNGVVNTWRTGINTVKNVWKSTFGRVLSKKPLSDFSFDHTKTRSLTLNNWFAKLQAGRGKEGSSSSKESKGTTVVAPVSTKDKEDKKDTKNKDEAKEEKKDGKKETDKSEGEKKTDKENKKDSEKKDTKEGKEKNKDEGKKDTEKKDETKEEKKDGKEEIDKTKESYKVAEDLVGKTDYGKKMYEHIRKSNPDIKFVFDKDSSVGSIKDKVITIGLKIPSDEKQIAPLNHKKDATEQTRHVLLHEMGHYVIHEKQGEKEVEKALKLSKSIFEKDKSTLTPLAQLSVYGNGDKKAREDLAEMLALYSNEEKKLDQYLSQLTSDKKEDEEYRNKFNLAKISEDDKKTIKDAVSKLVKSI